MAMKSVISRKGQVTIPAKVRKALGLKPGDRILYKVVDDKAELIPVKGTILDAAGTVRPKKRPENFAKIRETVKKRVSKQIAQKSK